MTRPTDEEKLAMPEMGTLFFDGQVLEVKAGDTIRGEARYNAEKGIYEGHFVLVPPVPPPEGMETTESECAALLVQAEKDDLSDAAGSLVSPSLLRAVLCDLRFALAEIARLTGELAEATHDANLFVYLHALALEHGYMPEPAESAYDFLQRAIMTKSPTTREVVARQEEREACGNIAHDAGMYSESYVDDPPDHVRLWNEACWKIRDKIRARTA